MSNPRPYFPYLDGLRAVAIALVLAVHTHPPILKGGFIGVDIFLIISGFLITLLLCEENKDTGKISLRNFFIRRALRIWPALLTFLAIGTLIQHYWLRSLLGPSPDLTLSWSWLMLANVKRAEGWRLGAFDHLWSVTMEEQFYLFWPVILNWLLSRRSFTFVNGIILRTAIFLMIAFLMHNGDFDLLLPFALRLYSGDRAVHLMLGAWIGYQVACSTKQGLVWTFIKSPSPILTSLALICLIAASLIPYKFFVRGEIFLVTIPACFLILHLYFCPNEWIGKILSTKAAVFIGKRSYSLYLWHYLVQELVGAIGTNGLEGAFWSISGTIILTLGSYSLIERPFLRLKNRLFTPVAEFSAALR